MTPGEQALREAARLEAARVYGRTCPEHRSERPQMVTGSRLDSLAAEYRQAGQSVASIAFRLGVTKSTVTEALRRVGAA